MPHWVNKVAIVTDCGDEVGLAVIEVLARAGMIVFGFSKYKQIVEVTENLKNITANKSAGKILLYICDITNLEQVETTINKIKDNYGSIDVLINNAYCNTDSLVSTGCLHEFKEIIDVNIFAMVAFTRLVAGSMIERDIRGSNSCTIEVDILQNNSMPHWVNKVAIVTDCGDEVGLAVIEVLARAGMIVFGFSKYKQIVEVTENLKNITTNKSAGKILLYICDITNLEQVETTINKIKDNYGSIDVLINNAYCNTDSLVSTGCLHEFKEIIDVNIFAMVAFTRLVAGSMIERDIRGHIININDLCSYQIPAETKKSVFIATKVAITSINEILRHEFRYLKANIKVTNIACGSIESTNQFSPDNPGLRIKDVAKLVKLLLNTPEHLHVHEVLLDSLVE